MTRYYKLASVDGGEWPEDQALQIGSIIRVPSSSSKRPGSVFNHATREWVSPRWVEVSDPRVSA